MFQWPSKPNVPEKIKIFGINCISFLLNMEQEYHNISATTNYRYDHF